jgi:hypothetical protein
MCLKNRNNFLWRAWNIYFGQSHRVSVRREGNTHLNKNLPLKADTPTRRYNIIYLFVQRKVNLKKKRSRSTLKQQPVQLRVLLCFAGMRLDRFLSSLDACAPADRTSPLFLAHNRVRAPLSSFGFAFCSRVMFACNLNENTSREISRSAVG